MCDSLTGRYCSLAEDNHAVCFVCLHTSFMCQRCFVSSLICSMSTSSFSFMSFFFFSFTSFLHLPFLSSPLFHIISSLCFLPFCGTSSPPVAFLDFPFPFSLRSPLPVLFHLWLNSRSSLLAFLPSLSTHPFLPPASPPLLFLLCSSSLPISSPFMLPSYFPLSTPPISSPPLCPPFIHLFHSSSLSSPRLSTPPPLEEHSNMYLMVPKPLDSFNLLRVKGKGLKQKVLHASCEW